MTQTLRLGIFSANVVADWAEEHGVFAGHGLAVEQIPVAVLPRPVRLADGGRVRRRPHRAGQRGDLRAERGQPARPPAGPADPARGRPRRPALAWSGGPGVRQPPTSPAAGSASTSRPPGSPSSASRCCAAAGLEAGPRLRGGHRRRRPRGGGSCSPTARSRPPCSTPGTRPARCGPARTCSASSATSSAPTWAPCSPPSPTSNPGPAAPCWRPGTRPRRRFWTREPRPTSLALLGRQPDTDAEIAAQMYETLLDPVHGLCAGGEVDPAALEAVLRLRAEQGGFEHDARPRRSGPARAAASCGRRA